MVKRGYPLIVWMTLAYALFLAEGQWMAWLDGAAATAAGGGQAVDHLARLLLGGP